MRVACACCGGVCVMCERCMVYMLCMCGVMCGVVSVVCGVCVCGVWGVHVWCVQTM